MIPPDPIERFRSVYALAEKIDRSIIPEPNAMALATIENRDQPSVRIVLLKAFDAQGFVFYTNYEGRKGRQLLAHPRAALCFYWPPIDIQVRIEGAVSKVADSEADAYFASRQRLSQIGAWASRQSEPLESASALDDRVARYEKEFAGRDVPRPRFWSGFRVHPERIEFWKARPNRLHERHVYMKDRDGWRIETLYP
ncbi:MAG TPA: pyridoxamine 5'-phosphate oxidase [Gemmatimonadaceae bacterium]|nr:pyridoxamine 5'-phosphate oxidase [Gemmatimonadaceae bacterium]